MLGFVGNAEIWVKLEVYLGVDFLSSEGSCVIEALKWKSTEEFIY